MAQTPEGKVKAAVKALLLGLKIYPASQAGRFPKDGAGWYYMPMQQGGVSGIPDFIGFYAPHDEPVFWAIETKAPGKKPTGFQKLQIESIRQAGGVCFVVDGDLSEFEAWAKGVTG